MSNLFTIPATIPVPAPTEATPARLGLSSRASRSGGGVWLTSNPACENGE